jgi:hypothetical protein
VVCSDLHEECDRCPWLHTLRQTATIYCPSGKVEKLSVARPAKSQPDRGNCDWQIASIDDLEANPGLLPRSKSFSRRDVDTQTIALKALPSVQNTEHCTEKGNPESDSDNERGVHLPSETELSYR